jgi:copper chaperone
MSASTHTVQLKTTGMHCRSCSMLVDMTLGDLEGVESSVTDLAGGITSVTFDPSTVSVDDFVAAIRSVGYEAELAQ